jgi:hypothetical protein
VRGVGAVVVCFVTVVSMRRASTALKNDARSDAFSDMQCNTGASYVYCLSTHTEFKTLRRSTLSRSRAPLHSPVGQLRNVITYADG